MAFIVKMGKRTTEQLIRANQQRNHLKALSRKSSFISEYIEIKYSGIYNEALHFFDAVNTVHPTKSDLRKTKEFRAWKPGMKGEEPRKSRKRKYNYLQNAPEPESPWPQSSEEPESPWPQSSEEPESPYPQSSEEPESQYSPPADNPRTSQTSLENSPSRYNDNMLLRIPLLKSPQSLQSTVTEQTLEPLTLDDIPPDRTEQLIIELQQDPSPSTVTTETIEIVTEQTLEPLTLDDIPPERIEQLITELQQDPDIMGMFTDIQAQLEFEELGLDIDIPELNLLEDELADW